PLCFVGGRQARGIGERRGVSPPCAPVVAHILLADYHCVSATATSVTGARTAGVPPAPRLPLATPLQTPLAPTLVVAGQPLILAPPIADYVWRADAVKILQKPGVTNVNLQGEMGDGYRAACFMAGAAMIVVGIIGSWSGRQPNLNPSRTLSDGSTSC